MKQANGKWNRTKNEINHRRFIKINRHKMKLLNREWFTRFRLSKKASKNKRWNSSIFCFPSHQRERKNAPRQGHVQLSVLFLSHFLSVIYLISKCSKRMTSVEMIQTLASDEMKNKMNKGETRSTIETFQFDWLRIHFELECNSPIRPSIRRMPK